MVARRCVVQTVLEGGAVAAREINTFRNITKWEFPISIMQCVDFPLANKLAIWQMCWLMCVLQPWPQCVRPGDSSLLDQHKVTVHRVGEMRPQSLRSYLNPTAPVPFSLIQGRDKNPNCRLIVSTKEPLILQTPAARRSFCFLGRHPVAHLRDWSTNISTLPLCCCHVCLPLLWFPVMRIVKINIYCTLGGLPPQTDPSTVGLNIQVMTEIMRM